MTLITAEQMLDELIADLAQRLVDRVIHRTEAEWRTLRLVDWGRCLLPGHFRRPPSRMHLWLSDELDRLTVVRGGRLNALGPRGSAKSTLVTLAYVLRSAVEGREPYIWIVSDTIDQARTHLAHVKSELEENQLLQAHYPRSSGRGATWRRDAIELRGGTVVEAFGTGQRLRGRRRREHRPSLIVCDDLQNDVQVASAMQRQASRDWFHSALLKAGDGRTNIVNLATALHRDALAMELHRSAGWNSQLFRAIERWPARMDLWADWEEFYVDREHPESQALAAAFYQENRAAMLEGAELLWPEHEGLYALMRMRIAEGRTAFEREKQNSPVDPAKCEWPEEYFDHHIWFSQWPEEFKARAMALDPSKGADARHGDYSAYVMLGVDEHDVYYVEADLKRRATPAMVAAGVGLCRRFEPQAFGIEANQYQELLIGEFKKEFSRRKLRSVTPVGVHNYANKLVRVRKLAPLLSERRLRFLAKSASTQLLVDQLRDFPLADHDDGPDALEMTLRLAQQLLAGPPPDDGLGDRLIA